jgi:hypothetical protein
LPQSFEIYQHNKYSNIKKSHSPSEKVLFLVLETSQEYVPRETSFAASLAHLFPKRRPISKKVTYRLKGGLAA